MVVYGLALHGYVDPPSQKSKKILCVCLRIPTIGDYVAETHRKIVLTLTTSPCVVIYSTKQFGKANT